MAAKKWIYEVKYTDGEEYTYTAPDGKLKSKKLPTVRVEAENRLNAVVAAAQKWASAGPALHAASSARSSDRRRRKETKMSNLSANAQLLGNLEHTTAELLEGMTEERGRGFASDNESWAALKGYLERAEKMRKDIEKVHKEMWDAIKDQNDDAYRALANELTRASSALAAEWITVSVLGKIAVEMTDE